MSSANSSSNSPHEVFPFSRTFIPTAIETSTLTATVTAHPSPSSSPVSEYTELHASAVARGTAGGIAALVFILSIAALWWRRTHRAPSHLYDTARARLSDEHDTSGGLAARSELPGKALCGSLSLSVFASASAWAYLSLG